MKTIKLIILALATIVVSSNVWGTVVDFTSQTVTTTTDGFTLSVSPFSFTAKKNDGTTNPAQNATAKDIRLYAKGTLQVTTTGDNMTQMVFAVSTAGQKRQAEITASNGSVSVDATNWVVTWTGSSKDVTFTVGDQATYGTEGSSKAGQFDVNSVNITTSTCTSINPTLSYTSSMTIGDADLMPTLNKDGSEGNVTYSIKTGSAATVNSSTGALHATAAGSVTVQATIAASGDKCEGSAVSNTITISAAPVYATVTWMVDGTTHHTSSNVTIGSTISTPTNPAAPASCGDAIFKGWTANNEYFHETAAPSDLFNGTSPTINGNITFYAVFADRQE